MPFDPNSAKKAGKKSKRGPAKKRDYLLKKKMEMLYEKTTDCSQFILIKLKSSLLP